MKPQALARPPRLLVAAGLATLLLTACGGGNEMLWQPPSPPPPVGPATVPPSATASPQAYTLFAASLAPSESAQPLLLGEGPAPTSETSEPEPVN